MQEAIGEGERFVLADFPAAELNRKNFDRVVRQCKTISVDTISDEKVAVPEYRPKIVLHQLQYEGERGAAEHPKD
jgi:hypothetical protein